jgi:outer membrane protein
MVLLRQSPSIVHPLLRSAVPLLLVAAAWPQVAAAQSCSEPSEECAVVGRWEISASIGVGERSNPVAGRSDIPLVVVPRISYYGKRFFLENLELGFTLHEGLSNTFNLVATPGYDRAFFVRSDLQNIFIPFGATTAIPTSEPVALDGSNFAVGSRHTTYLLGPEWSFQYGAIAGQVTALREVTGEHDGYEVRAAFAVPLLRSKSSLVVSSGLTWKSEELVRYYYGVDRLYEPDSALSPFIKLQFSRPISDRWRVSAFAHYEHLADDIADSPVVSENHVTTFFAGVSFRIR